MRKIVNGMLCALLIMVHIPQSVQAIIEEENSIVIEENRKVITGTLDVIEEYNRDVLKETVETAANTNYFQLTNATQRIAVIDTGVALGHPALADMKVVNVWNMVDGTTNIRDAHGHGTHITGVLASNGKQVAVHGIVPSAEYILIKALNDKGETNDYILAQSIRRATNFGARVIVVSSGISVHSTTLQEAVDYAYANNVLIVAAAGNNVKQPQYPAAYSNVLSVGSINKLGVRSSFTPSGYENDVLAVGENVLSLNTDRGTRLLSGSSMATPIVAALALGLYQINPNATVDDIMSHILLTSSNANRWNTSTGWGSVDYHTAVFTKLQGNPSTQNNNSVSNVLTIPRNTIIAGTTDSDKFKWYRIASGYSGVLRITVKKQNLQPMKIDLFDQSHRLIASRTVTNREETVTFSLNTDGMFIRLSNSQHTTNTKYSLMTNFTIASDIWEANNLMQQSKRIPLRASFDATLHSAGDHDWYYVDVLERGYLQVNVWNGSEYMDPVLQVQGNNNRFTIDQNPAGKDESFIRLVEAGRYHIRVNDYNENTINYPYTLDVGFTPINTSRLTDITQHWARDDINRLLAQGIVKGYTNNRFLPNNYISRAEFTSLLVSSLKLAHPESNNRTYRDVPTNHWSHYPLTIASQNNVVKGYPDQTFRPDAFVTRAEVASMVYEMYKGQLRYSSVKTYRDVSTRHWAYTPITNLTRAEIVTGYNNSEYRPNAYISRAEAATVIARLLNL